MNEIIDSFEELASLIASDYNANGPKSLYNRQGTIIHLRGFLRQRVKANSVVEILAVRRGAAR